ncbi:unnamed protein product, partial [Coregonus sp. 'balchen']
GPLPLSSLRLFVPPLRLVSAALWQVVQRRDIMDYGLVEEFVTTVLEVVPDLMSYRERVQLIMGLRAQLVLELCHTDQLADPKTIQPHLNRMRTCIITLRKNETPDPEVEASKSNFLKLIQSLLEDPVKREHFFQNVFLEEFGPKYDSTLQSLVWEFLSRLEKLLPTPTLHQTASWFLPDHSVLEECVQSVCHPESLKTLLQYHKPYRHLDTNALSSSDNHILSSLSLLETVEIFETEIQSEPMQGFMNIQSSASSDNEFEMNRHFHQPQTDSGLKIQGNHHSSQLEVQDSSSLSTSCLFLQPTVLLHRLDITDMLLPVSSPTLRIKSSSKSRTCHVCHKTFYTVYSMRKHLIFKHDQLIYQCHDCGEHFKRKFNLREHKAECHPTLSSKARTCRLCNKTFGSPYLMRKHLKSQHDQLPYQCGDCEENFKRKCHLKEHKKKCPTMFSCLSCGEKFEERCNLKEHKKECLVVKKLLSCSLCKKTFIEARGLTAHMRSHEKRSNLKEHKACLAAKRLHSCSMCNKAFIKVHDLKAHWRSHTYQCMQCLQSFEHQENLQKHLQYVREEAAQLEEDNTFRPSFEEEIETSQPHNTSNVCRNQRYSFRARTCRLCHKTFNSIALMRTHLNSKHAQLPYQCLHCGENFKKKINLKEHRKERHPTSSLQPKESIKARTCRLCHNTFDSTFFMRKHLKSQHGQLPYQCLGCGENFIKNSHLREHKKECFQRPQQDLRESSEGVDPNQHPRDVNVADGSSSLATREIETEIP